MNFMLCKKREEPFNREGWVAEKKYDGSRVKIEINNGEIRLESRKGNSLTKKFPEFEDIEVEGEYILDGEIVLMKGGKSRFNDLLRRINQENKFKIELLSEKYPCKIAIFDILEYNGEGLRNKKLKKRWEYLEMFFNKVKKGREHFIKVKQHENILDLWKEVKSSKLEGIIMKDINSKYEGERSSKWLKVKIWNEVVLEFDRYEENNKGITLENGDGIRVAVLGNQSKGVADRIDKNGSVKAEIQYLEKTKNNKYRKISFKRLIK